MNKINNSPLKKTVRPQNVSLDTENAVSKALPEIFFWKDENFSRKVRKKSKKKQFWKKNNFPGHVHTLLTTLQKIFCQQAENFALKIYPEMNKTLPSFPT